MQTFFCRLDVHNKLSDIDLLYVAPPSITYSDFFNDFANFLRGNPDTKRVENTGKEEYGHGGMLTFSFKSFSFELKFANISRGNSFRECEGIVTEIKELQETDSVNRKADAEREDTLRRLKEVHVHHLLKTKQPNYDSFKTTLRAVRCWAISKGVYDQITGYFGGTILAVMVARICKLNPQDSPFSLLQKFFSTYSSWKWNRDAVVTSSTDQDSLPNHVISVMKPGYHEENVATAVTQSNLDVIIAELRRGEQKVEDIGKVRFFIVRKSIIWILCYALFPV